MKSDRDVAADYVMPPGIYLNSAAVSPMTRASVEAVARFHEEYCTLGPDTDASDELARGAAAAAREAVSRAVSCSPGEISLTQCTTDGIGMVARGLGLRPGSNVVVRGMGHEHHANLYPWLGTPAGVRSMPVDGDGFFEMGELRSRVDGSTGLVALSHALYNTGAIIPVGEAAAELRGRAPLFADCAQSAGCVGVDLPSMGCDFAAFNGSKWLCGPLGTGALYCRAGAAAMLEPPAVGAESSSEEGGRLVHVDGHARFEAAFRNYAGAAGLAESARYLLDIGIGEVRRRNARLAGVLRDGISRIPGATVYGPDDPGLRTSIVPFNVGRDPAYVVARLRSRGIMVAEREMDDVGMVRASPHVFNTEEEMEEVVRVLRSL
ncbi:MAG: aminotransferase class V-fold PLP-dependent enzyme [Nitrosopumilus sp.]|nr:aminotransferase class V-fold PLP-dependent enzyme [Nitrosopumilus sp.]MDA7942490.1 aminotransferase class V-fold PLP-dependent enzyme [Nitrosopumilus sp.]MDA7958204.1 aminotransferase class V-fold PLP-dependent enzyme [Nitrosopumilus sp.]MDA7959342.1 aminotransferase class V-fold PLP-dependent enzyme [Nitrosopumilus sp.]